MLSGCRWNSLGRRRSGTLLWRSWGHSGDILKMLLRRFGMNYAPSPCEPGVAWRGVVVWGALLESARISKASRGDAKRSLKERCELRVLSVCRAGAF